MAAPIFPMMHMCCSYPQQINPIQQQKATILKCQNCGASEYDSNNDGKCDYCGTQIIPKRHFFVVDTTKLTSVDADALIKESKRYIRYTE